MSVSAAESIPAVEPAAIDIFREFSPEARRAVAEAEWRGIGIGPNTSPHHARCQREVTVVDENGTALIANVQMCPIGLALFVDGKLWTYTKRDVENWPKFKAMARGVPDGFDAASMLIGLERGGYYTLEDHGRLMQHAVLAKRASDFMFSWDAGEIAPEQLASALAELDVDRGV